MDDVIYSRNKYDLMWQRHNKSAANQILRAIAFICLRLQAPRLAICGVIQEGNK